MQEMINRPCAGVIPFLRDVGLDEEDGVAIEDRRTADRIWGRRPRESASTARALRVGVIAFPHLANFTDFDALAAEPSVALAYLERPEDALDADLLILPGSKQTLDDLAWLARTGFAEAIRRRQERGGATLGICGGMQMLGRRVTDPGGMESQGRTHSSRGLELLPIETVLTAEKVTRRAAGRLRRASVFGKALECSSVEGYEIHLGETVYDAAAEPFAEISRENGAEGLQDGAVSADGKVVGSYLHGMFEQDAFRHAFVRAARAACGLAAPDTMVLFGAERQARFDRLARHVADALDINSIESWLK
jgi:adenosylcobyric acid synthase